MKTQKVNRHVRVGPYYQSNAYLLLVFIEVIQGLCVCVFCAQLNDSPTLCNSIDA